MVEEANLWENGDAFLPLVLALEAIEVQGASQTVNIQRRDEALRDEKRRAFNIIHQLLDLLFGAENRITANHHCEEALGDVRRVATVVDEALQARADEQRDHLLRLLVANVEEIRGNAHDLTIEGKVGLRDDAALVLAAAGHGGREEVGGDVALERNHGAEAGHGDAGLMTSCVD